MSEQRDRAERRPARPVVAIRHGRLKRSAAWKTLLGFVATSLAVLLVSGAAVAAISITQFRQSLADHSVDINATAAPPPSVGAYEGGFNMLIVGSDEDAATRDSVLNDVNILVHVSADHTRAVAVSIPRDMVVPFPACTDPETGKTSSPMTGRPINEALYYGGLACAVTVVEKLTNLDIQFAAMTTFTGVARMADAVGGVDVCVADDFYDPYTQVRLSAGHHLLGGHETMLFLRSRHGVGDGSDLTRISSQQAVLSSLLRTIKSTDTLTNVGKLYSIAQVVTQSMTLSTEMANPDTLVALAQALNKVGLDRMTFVRYPGTTGGTGIYQGKVQPTVALANKLFDKIRADEPFELAQVGSPGGGSQGSELDPNATPIAPEQTSSGSAAPTDAAEEPAEVLNGLSGQTAADQTCTVPN
jgi:LCP family protein required for cell wall assembly